MPRRIHNGRGRASPRGREVMALEFGEPLPLESADSDSEVSPWLISAGFCGLGLSVFLFLPVIGTIAHAAIQRMVM